jgi:antitoxin Phd
MKIRSRTVDDGPTSEGRWQVQTARAQLSALVDQALQGRPQRITRRGRDVAVVISAEAYERLTGAQGGLVEFFRTSPLAEAVSAGELDLERDRDPIRDLDL